MSLTWHELRTKVKVDDDDDDNTETENVSQFPNETTCKADGLLRYVNVCAMQLERSLVSDDVANEEFSSEISEQHAGMTPLALACALNELPSVKVWRRLLLTAISCVSSSTCNRKFHEDSLSRRKKHM